MVRKVCRGASSESKGELRRPSRLGGGNWRIVLTNRVTEETGEPGL